LASIAKAGGGLPGGVANQLSSGLGQLASVSVDLPDGGRIADSAVGAVGAGAEAATGAAGAGADAAGDTLDAGKGAVEDAEKAVKGLGGRLFGDD
ncbi:MAG: P-type conjugative transfer protein TrbL, partial [Thermoanaerobaculia bacterium]